MNLADVKPIRIRFPPAHPVQEIFTHWNYLHPNAQCLIAPCGTKLGKSFGCSLWLAREAMVNPGLYCIWIAPTQLKAQIGYRYIKSLLPESPLIKCLDSTLEIKFLGNRSFIKFLHGRDAETTVEGEAVDRFVIDEAGKQKKQLWHSLFTTLTQTGGLGIITGTPRGFTWYYDEFRKAKLGDPFYCWAHLKTEQSPFVKFKAVEQAKRILPPALFEQYYNAAFLGAGTTFGDISKMFDESLEVKNPLTKFWIHPDPAMRALDTVTGWDIAKRRDYSIFYTVNVLGVLVGYVRMRGPAYQMQVLRLKHYMHTYFTGERYLRYDATGVGDAVGEMIVDADIDASITPVTFTNKSKQEMVSRTTHAIESGWHKAPRIEQIEHEFSCFELKVSRSGLFTYSAPDGDNDDVVCAAMLAISGAYQSARLEDTEKYLAQLMEGHDEDDEEMDELLEKAAGEFAGDDGFFEGESQDNSDDDFSMDDFDD